MTLTAGPRLLIRFAVLAALALCGIVLALSSGTPPVGAQDGPDATLSGLVLNDGTNDLTLTPTFATDTTSYTASVGDAVSQITVTPTKSDTDASVEYLDAKDAAITDADGTATGQQVDLAVGTTTIKVKVTAGDAMTTETYTVVVTRAATRPAPPSGKAWVEVWSDDFDGDVLDATKWLPRRESQNLKTQKTPWKHDPLPLGNRQRKCRRRQTGLEGHSQASQRHIE